MTCWKCAQETRADSDHCTRCGAGISEDPFDQMPEAKPESLADGAALIAAERSRQVTAEGYDSSHDDVHASGEILRAAHAYLAVAINPEKAEDIGGIIWPWDRLSFKPSGPIPDLVKSGALIAAEIDRLRRAHITAEARPEAPAFVLSDAEHSRYVASVIADAATGTGDDDSPLMASLAGMTPERVRELIAEQFAVLTRPLPYEASADHIADANEMAAREVNEGNGGDRGMPEGGAGNSQERARASAATECACPARAALRNIQIDATRAFASDPKNVVLQHIAIGALAAIATPCPCADLRERLDTAEMACVEGGEIVGELRAAIQKLKDDLKLAESILAVKEREAGYAGGKVLELRVELAALRSDCGCRPASLASTSACDPLTCPCACHSLRAQLAAMERIRQNASTCVGLLEDAGMGKVGPNCLTDMTAEIVRALAVANERADGWQEREASICPEDVGFVEYIGVLRRQLVAANVQSGDNLDGKWMAEKAHDEEMERANKAERDLATATERIAALEKAGVYAADVQRQLTARAEKAERQRGIYLCDRDAFYKAIVQTIDNAADQLIAIGVQEIPHGEGCAATLAAVCEALFAAQNEMKRQRDAAREELGQAVELLRPALKPTATNEGIQKLTLLADWQVEALAVRGHSLDIDAIRAIVARFDAAQGKQ